MNTYLTSEDLATISRAALDRFEFDGTDVVCLCGWGISSTNFTLLGLVDECNAHVDTGECELLFYRFIPRD